MSKAIKFNDTIKKYIAVRLETQSNKTAIAREVQKAFSIDQDIDRIRKKISNFALKNNITARTAGIKRLFFDIENAPYKGWFWQTGWKQTVGTHQIDEDKRIIMVCYKWQHEDKVHVIKWDKNQDDKELLEKFIKVLGEADEAIAHNGDRFDIKELRTRAIMQGVLMFPKYRTFDTLKKARQYFNFPSNRLDYLGEISGFGGKMETNYDLWREVVDNKSSKAMKEMVEYCIRDVLVLEAVFYWMSPFVNHETNFAVKLGKGKWCCPECGSEKVKLSHTDTTRMGYIKRHFKCNDCRKFYHVSNRTYLSYLKEVCYNA